MSFSRYPKYKSSGVEWLGDVPEHWDCSRLKEFSRFSGGGTPTRENLAYWSGSIPWVSPKDMKSEIVLESEESITELGLNSSATSLVPPGAVLLVVRSGVLKHTIPVGINQVSVTLNQDMKAIRPELARCLPFFLLRWIQGLNDQLLDAWSKQGATVESIEHDYLSKTIVPLPPLPEQRSIAAFLDAETSKIDALVSEQEHLIALLREKRQAVISHAVTKGLNPNVKMRPSGVEWLGDVPVHWEVKRLKYLGEAITGLTYSPDDIVEPGEGTLVLRSSNVQSGKIALDDCVFVGCEIPAELRTRSGDILICSRNGSRDLIGKNAMIDGSSEGSTFGAFMTVFRSQHARYIECVLNSPIFEYQSGQFLTSTINQLTIGTLNDFAVPFPPKVERDQIAESIREVRQTTNALAVEAERAISLLKERRSALISAAVTGQIDVRGAVPA